MLALATFFFGSSAMSPLFRFCSVLLASGSRRSRATICRCSHWPPSSLTLRRSRPFSASARRPGSPKRSPSRGLGTHQSSASSSFQIKGRNRAAQGSCRWQWRKWKSESSAGFARKEKQSTEITLFFPIYSYRSKRQRLGLMVRHASHYLCGCHFLRRGCGTPGALIMRKKYKRSTDLC